MISIFTLLRKNLTPPTHALCISSQYTWQPPKSTSKYAGIAICCFLLEISLISGSLLRSPTGLDVWYQGKRVFASACSNWHFQLVSSCGFCRSIVMPTWALMFADARHACVVAFWGVFQQKIKVFQTDWERSSRFYGISSCPIFLEPVVRSFLRHSSGPLRFMWQSHKLRSSKKPVRMQGAS